MSQPTTPSETTTQPTDQVRRETDAWWIKAIENLGLFVDTTGGLESLCIQAPIGKKLNDRGVVVDDASSIHAELLAQRYALLSACEAALELIEGEDPGAGCDSQAEAETARDRFIESVGNCLRSAIVKATGGAA